MFGIAAQVGDVAAASGANSAGTAARSHGARRGADRRGSSREKHGTKRKWSGCLSAKARNSSPYNSSHRRARAEQQHDLDAALRDELFELRQHRAIRRHAGAGADQQVALVGIGGHQAEAAIRAAGVDVAALVQAFEQGRRRAAGDVAHRDLHRFARAHRVVVDGRQRIAALGRGAVGVMEVHLQELAGDEIQRLPVVADEGQVGDARREHAAADELEREVLDGHGMCGCLRATVAGRRHGAAYTTGIAAAAAAQVCNDPRPIRRRRAGDLRIPAPAPRARCPRFRSATCARPTTPACRRSRACRWTCSRATSSRCSAPTAPASRP